MEASSVLRCRRLAVHGPHEHVRNGETFSCVGIEDDHENRCCLAHGVHVTPHRGCMLR